MKSLGTIRSWSRLLSRNRPFFPLGRAPFPSGLCKDIPLVTHLSFNFFLTTTALIIVQICCDFPQSGKPSILMLLLPPTSYFYRKKKKILGKIFVDAVSGSYSSIFSVGFTSKMHLLSDVYLYHPGPSHYHLSSLLDPCSL